MEPVKYNWTSAATNEGKARFRQMLDAGEFVATRYKEPGYCLHFFSKRYDDGMSHRGPHYGIRGDVATEDFDSLDATGLEFLDLATPA